MNQAFLALHKVENLWRDADFFWFVCGGWAIDLFLGEVTRSHKDVDVAIWRADQLAMQSYLTARGWMIEVAADGQLTPWTSGGFIELPLHNVWCKHGSYDPDFLEVLLNERDDDSFLFRRDLSVKRPLPQTILHNEKGFAYLAPEIVLLYKAKQFSNAQNEADFTAVLPKLPAESRNWLRTNLAKLHQGHPWLTDLS